MHKSLLLAALGGLIGGGLGGMNVSVSDRIPQIRHTPYPSQRAPLKGKPGSKLARKAAQGKIGITHPR